MVSYHAMWIYLLALGIAPSPSRACVSGDPSIQADASAPAAPAAAASDSFELAPGVVVDPTTKRVYIMTPDQKVAGLESTPADQSW